jgi:hypothetical protein
LYAVGFPPAREDVKKNVKNRWTQPAVELSVVCIFHSILDVRCSVFDVHLSGKFKPGQALQ